MQLSRINSLVELFFSKYKEINSVADKPFLKWLKENEKNFFTWEQVKFKIQILSEYLRTNLADGDRCILLSENRPEWLISDISIMNAGGVTVPLFTTYSEKDYEYIINDCKPKICIVSNEIQFKKIEKFISEEIKVLSIENINERVENIENILDAYLEKKKSGLQISYNQNLERKDLACIIYTSGTTGNPKGVMLSHGGILSNCEGAQEILNKLVQDSEPTFLTWLPLSHSYEHAVQFVQISLGAKIYYAESLEKLLSNMSIAKPTIMTAVPRFYQNLYSKISMNFSKQKGFKKKLISSTISLGTKKLNSENLTLKEKLINFLCEKLVRKKIKNQFGGELKAFVSGGGALDQNIGEFLNAVGLPTLQGYGLTEASPVVSCNLPDLVKVESVGPPFRTNKVRIAEDGEILIKGENVMLGYWNLEEETKKVIKDGWLHTGDIGEIDNNNYLKITDRKKDIIVNLGGDNISPSKIENILCLSLIHISEPTRLLSSACGGLCL